MERSEDRILTTHAGSLPRPASLTTLFARRVRGESVDLAEMERQAREALRAIVRKQIENGLDVIDDGEQSRDSFVLYLRHRLTGLGGVGSLGETTCAERGRATRLTATVRIVSAPMRSVAPEADPAAIRCLVQL